MDKGRNKKSKGQILVIVVMMLIGLMAMLGLVLDGGNFYTHRRQAQLAADAGALAGARAYCLTEDVDAAISSAWDYAVNRNDAQAANITVDGGTYEVTVDTSINFNTFFLGFVGRNQLTATASATAGCSPPTSGIGVMPIAWSCRPPDDPGSDSDDCDLYLMDHYEDANGDGEEGDGNGQCIYGEDPMYIVVDSADIAEDLVCWDPPNIPPAGSEEGVLTVDCDIDDDGIDDLKPISGGNRSWLDLDGGGGGAADLKDWIENGLEDTITIHTWFAGQSGVSVAVYNAVNDYQLGNDVVIPVFDQVCPYGVPSGSPENPCHSLWHSGIDTVVESGGASTDYFHIISFAIFRVECVDAGSNPKGKDGCPAHDGLLLDPDVKTIEGCFVEGFDAGLGGGGGPTDTGTIVVYLKR
jgi:Flp pilus assembly protein TadG